MYTHSTAPDTIRYKWGILRVPPNFQMDEVATYSVTAQPLAEDIARACGAPNGVGGPLRTLVEPFACVGGNTRAFLAAGFRVLAVEQDEARHAALVANCADRAEHLETRCGRWQDHVPADRRAVAFLDPPWGGPDCREKRFRVDGMTMRELVEFWLARCARVVVKLPVYYDTRGEFGAMREFRADRVLGRDKMRMVIFERRWAILIPYRAGPGQEERAAQLAEIVPHLERMFAGTGCEILVAEQTDDGRLFNRGALLNAAFRLVRGRFPNLTHVITHDVDLKPSPELFRAYVDPPAEGTVTHVGGVWKRYDSDSYLGGVLSVRAEDFPGYPNDIWGWGGEDDVLRDRIRARKLKVVRPAEGTLADLEAMDLATKMQWLRDRKQKCMDKWERVRAHRRALGRSEDVRECSFDLVRQLNEHHVLLRLGDGPASPDWGRGYWSRKRPRGNTSRVDERPWRRARPVRARPDAAAGRPRDAGARAPRNDSARRGGAPARA